MGSRLLSLRPNSFACTWKGTLPLLLTNKQLTASKSSDSSCPSCVDLDLKSDAWGLDACVDVGAHYSSRPTYVGTELVSA